MIFLGVLLCLAIIGAIIYMAVSKKSNFHTRLVSLIALSVMILAVIICVILVFTGDHAPPEDPSTLIVGAPAAAAEEHHNILPIVIFMVFLIALLACADKHLICSVYIFNYIHRQILQSADESKTELLGRFLCNRHHI